MPKKKYYAVLNGKKPGIYTTWDACKAQVHGYPNAVYKSFLSREEAEQYMNSDSSAASPPAGSGLNTQVDRRLAALEPDEVIAFVDGSYDNARKKAAFGAILFTVDGRDELYGSYGRAAHADLVALRNVAGELAGVQEAVRWAIRYGMRKITVFYDYAGIQNWADGLWKTNKDLTKAYAAFIRESRQTLDVEFVKVPAHSGITYNEEVDAIAKHAIASGASRLHDHDPGDALS